MFWFRKKNLPPIPKLDLGFGSPIQKPGFSRTLPSRLHSDEINPKTKEVG